MIPHSCKTLCCSCLQCFCEVCGRKRKLCYFLRETDGLFESPDILDGVHVLLLYLLLDSIRQVAEEVDASVVFQGLDVDHVVAELVAALESLVYVREPIAEGTVSILVRGLVEFLLQYRYEEILRYWNVAIQLCLGNSTFISILNNILFAIYSSSLYYKEGVAVYFWLVTSNLGFHLVPSTTLIEVAVLWLHIGHVVCLETLVCIVQSVSVRTDMTMVESLCSWSRVFCEIGNSILLFQVSIVWILALSLRWVISSANVCLAICGIECIAAPALALLRVVPFCAIVNHISIHVNHDVVIIYALDLRELQSADGVSYHLWHVGCSHVLIGVVGISRACITACIITRLVLLREVELQRVVSSAGRESHRCHEREDEDLGMFHIS